jgi:hypothetical protein
MPTYFSDRCVTTFRDVTTNTQTTNGDKSTTKNGKGVATGPNGTTCAKGYNNAGCTPPK